jgi:hypothetical protein
VFSIIALIINIKINMKEIKNYIFIDMTEIIHKHYKNSKYLSYSSFCNNYGRYIIDGIIPEGNRTLLTELYDYLKTVYSFSNEEVGEYLLEYVTLGVEQLSNLHRISVSLKKCFPYSYR